MNPKHTLRPRRHPRRGSTLVEFALCLPVLITLLAGVVDLSAFVSTIEVASRAAREGARVGSAVIEGATPTGDGIEAAATEQATLLLTEMGRPCATDCTVSAEWVRIGTNWFVRVRVQYPYDPVVGLVTFLPGHASAQFTMMTQQQP